MPSRQIKGLSNFIADIRACPSKDLEEKRVEKEISKIREKFAAGKQLNGYERKKCIWKLVYISMLGYDIPFGQIEALNLISSSKYSEKSAGYIASGLLLVENAEVLGLSINLIKADLQSLNEAVAALAFNFLANVGTEQMCEILFNDVQRIANMASGSRPYIRRKAYLAMLRFVRLRPDTLPPNVWASRLSHALQNEKDIGCLTSLSSLILGVLELHETGWQSVLPPSIQLLSRLSVVDVTPYAMYNGVMAPWLQMKLLRIIQFFPPPSDQPSLMSNISEIVHKIVSHSPTLPRAPHQSGQSNKRRNKADHERVNRSNIEHAIFFEAVNLITSYGSTLDFHIKKTAATTLSGMAIVRDGNIRCLRLAALSRLANDAEIVSSLQKQLNSIMEQLTDSDDMIRKQALNLLFVICNSDTWETIVDRFLEALKIAEPQNQEEIVLKVAILVEKFAPDFTWYIDCVFTMIEYAPDAVGEPVWHRAVQMVSGQNQELQLHATRKAYDSLSDRYADELLVRLGAYLLGEFGHLITDEAPGKQQLAILHRHFGRVSSSTKALLLLSYAKLLSTYEELNHQILSIFDDNSQSADVEVQQRAVEMMRLCQLDSETLDSVLAEMPAYPVATLKTSPLIRRLKFRNQQGAVKREFLEEAAMTEGQLLKPSTNKEEIENDEDVETSTDKSASRKGSEEDSTEESTEESEADSEESEDLNGKISGRNNRRSSRELKRLPSNENSTTPPLTLPNVDPSNVVALFRRLCLTEEGLLYSSPNIRVSVRHQYKPPLGRIVLNFINIGGCPIEIQNIAIEPSTSLQVSAASPIPDAFIIPPNGSARQNLQVELLEPYLVPPKYAVRANVLSSVPTMIFIQSSLPCILSCFITPTKITSEMFRKYWQSASQTINPQDYVIISRPSSAITTPSMFESYLSQAFHFYTQRIVKSICGSGTLTVSNFSEAKSSSSTACLVKIDFELETSKAMVAVRTPIPMVSYVLLQLLATYLLTPVSQTQQSVSSVSVQHRSSQPTFPTYPTGQALDFFRVGLGDSLLQRPSFGILKEQSTTSQNSPTAVVVNDIQTASRFTQKLIYFLRELGALTEGYLFARTGVDLSEKIKRGLFNRLIRDQILGKTETSLEVTVQKQHEQIHLAVETATVINAQFDLLLAIVSEGSILSFTKDISMFISSSNRLERNPSDLQIWNTFLMALENLQRSLRQLSLVYQLNASQENLVHSCLKNLDALISMCARINGQFTKDIFIRLQSSLQVISLKILQLQGIQLVPKVNRSLVPFNFCLPAPKLRQSSSSPEDVLPFPSDILTLHPAILQDNDDRVYQERFNPRTGLLKLTQDSLTGLFKDFSFNGSLAWNMLAGTHREPILSSFVDQTFEGFGRSDTVFDKERRGRNSANGNLHLEALYIRKMLVERYQYIKSVSQTLNDVLTMLLQLRSRLRNSAKRLCSTGAQSRAIQSQLAANSQLSLVIDNALDQSPKLQDFFSSIKSSLTTLLTLTSSNNNLPKQPQKIDTAMHFNLDADNKEDESNNEIKFKNPNLPNVRRNNKYNENTNYNEYKTAYKNINNYYIYNDQNNHDYDDDNTYNNYPKETLRDNHSFPSGMDKNSFLTFLSNLSYFNQYQLSKQESMILINLIRSGVFHINSNGQLQLQLKRFQDTSELSEQVTMFLRTLAGNQQSQNVSTLSNEIVIALLQYVLNNQKPYHGVVTDNNMSNNNHNSYMYHQRKNKNGLYYNDLFDKLFHDGTHCTSCITGMGIEMPNDEYLTHDADFKTVADNEKMGSWLTFSTNPVITNMINSLQGNIVTGVNQDKDAEYLNQQRRRIFEILSRFQKSLGNSTNQTTKPLIEQTQETLTATTKLLLDIKLHCDDSSQTDNSILGNNNCTAQQRQRSNIISSTRSKVVHVVEILNKLLSGNKSESIQDLHQELLLVIGNTR